MALDSKGPWLKPQQRVKTNLQGVLRPLATCKTTSYTFTPSSLIPNKRVLNKHSRVQDPFHSQVSLEPIWIFCPCLTDLKDNKIKLSDPWYNPPS